jgi:hypothetical protein
MTSVAIATKSNVYGKPAAIPANRPPFRQIGHHSGGPEKSGWFRSGIMAGLLRNGWPVSSGISGRFGPEYAGNHRLPYLASLGCPKPTA